ncbi:MAG TPA: ABC transporter permease [Bacteroidales bacterium]|nr:ABC transporter permease [Bacteroidales bacterium]HSA42273.1 ABC transporter permease [Bacteroidales bacterium]
MTLLIGALTVGLILALLALGTYISFRIFHFPDITAEGSLTLGAAVSASLIVMHVNPLLTCLMAFFAGSLAGICTAIIHTRFKINGLLSGILVMTALYTVNLHVMGKSNVSLSNTPSVFSVCQPGIACFSDQSGFRVLGWFVNGMEFFMLIFNLLLIVGFTLLLFWFFRTNTGTAMRATGDNQQMIRALGVDTSLMIMLGLGLSNGLIALSGALLAQYQGFSDVQMGIGMLVWGLASVIIGDALVDSKSLGFLLTGAVLGSVIFRLLVAVALQWGLDPNDLKLITAVFVLAALVLPGMIGKMKKKGGAC